jgi:cardiolipin synthase
VVHPASPSNTPPRPHHAWATRLRRVGRRVLRWTISAVVTLLALIGTLHITRGTSVRHVETVSTDGRALAVADPGFVQAVGMLTGASLMPGHVVEVMLNGDGTYERLWADLRAAEHSITLQLYYGMPGRMAQTLTAILRERAAAGVDIHVLYDAFGTIDIPDQVRDALREAGIDVQPFRPIRFKTLHMAQHRSHVRGIVIDGRIGWTGGFGIDDKWYGDGLTAGAWRETNVRFEGPAVRQLQAAFAAAWAEATGVLYTGRVAEDNPAAGSVMAGLLYATPTLGTTSAERFLAMSIAAAREKIYITNAYFAPGDGLVGLLIDAARRGVDVHIVTGGPGTDVRIVRYAGRASYERLLESGVRIYEWLPSILHAKTFVIDGQWTSIGSINFDNRSLVLNDEVTLMVLDEAIGRQMEAVFADDLRHTREVTLDGFRQRSIWERILEYAATQLLPLL